MLELVELYPLSVGPKGEVVCTGHFYETESGIDLRFMRVQIKKESLWITTPFWRVYDPLEKKMVHVPIYSWADQKTKTAKVGEMQKLVKKYLKENKLDLNNLHKTQPPKKKPEKS